MTAFLTISRLRTIICLLNTIRLLYFNLHHLLPFRGEFLNRGKTTKQLYFCKATMPLFLMTDLIKLN